jgi:hypothetical protein
LEARAYPAPAIRTRIENMRSRRNATERAYADRHAVLFQLRLPGWEGGNPFEAKVAEKVCANPDLA